MNINAYFAMVSYSRHRQHLNCREDAGGCRVCPPIESDRPPIEIYASPHRDLGVLPSKVQRWMIRGKIASQD